LICAASQVGIENTSIGVQMANSNDGVEVLNTANVMAAFGSQPESIGI
jgi:hypothetical protein